MPGKTHIKKCEKNVEPLSSRWGGGVTRLVCLPSSLAIFLSHHVTRVISKNSYFASPFIMANPNLRRGDMKPRQFCGKGVAKLENSSPP